MKSSTLANVYTAANRRCPPLADGMGKRCGHVRCERCWTARGPVDSLDGTLHASER
jgi:hypothetical protein